MPSSTYTRPFALFLAAAALLSKTEAAAPPAGEFGASQWFPKGATVANGTHVLGVHDTSDGCPVGWVECSYYTCYPLDGSTCCSDGNFCRPGYYCDGGGCCPNGKICGGVAPPPSTINGGTFTSTSTTTVRATIPATTARTSTIVTATFSTAVPSPSTSVSVGFSTPVQSTEFGTVPVNTSTVNTPTVNTVLPTLATTAGSNAPTSGIGRTNGAAPLGAGASLWLAGLIAVAMCIV